jgi:hypothetical protein
MDGHGFCELREVFAKRTGFWRAYPICGRSASGPNLTGYGAPSLPIRAQFGQTGAESKGTGGDLGVK